MDSHIFSCTGPKYNSNHLVRPGIGSPLVFTCFSIVCYYLSTEEPGGHSPWGRTESDMTKMTLHACTYVKKDFGCVQPHNFQNMVYVYTPKEMNLKFFFSNYS